jgi:hypothetical protein
VSHFSKFFNFGVTKIIEIAPKNKHYKVGIYSSQSSATVESSIQIRKIDNGDLIQLYDRYNYLNRYQLFNDTLILELSNSVFLEEGIDTFILKLP